MPALSSSKDTCHTRGGCRVNHPANRVLYLNLATFSMPRPEVPLEVHVRVSWYGECSVSASRESAQKYVCRRPVMASRHACPRKTCEFPCYSSVIHLLFPCYSPVIPLAWNDDSDATTQIRTSFGDQVMKLISARCPSGIKGLGCQPDEQAMRSGLSLRYDSVCPVQVRPYVKETQTIDGEGPQRVDTVSCLVDRGGRVGL